jgi:hypothetical protein
MPWTSYVDSVGGGKYAFRIYLSEGQGVVLGANFMNGYNIIFDPDGSKIGFAKSICKYEDFAVPLTRSPTIAPITSPGEIDTPSNDNSNNNECISELIPLTECNAYCNNDNNNAISIDSHKYIREWGNQTWGDSCGPSSETYQTIDKPCSITCKDGKMARGSLTCPESPWSQCDKACIQYRY